jgi:hypothetical protein
MRSVLRLCLPLFLIASFALAQQAPRIIEAPKQAEPAKKVEPVKPSLLSGILGGLAPAKDPKSSPQKVAAEKGTHQVGTPIKVKGTDGRSQMQTISIDNEGRVLALVAPPRGYGASPKGATGEVHVFSSEGKALTNWKVDFHAQAINAGPDGSIFVAGDGKVAKFDKKGRKISQVTLPFIEKLLADKEAMRKGAEAELKQRNEAMKRSRENIKKQMEKIKDIALEKRTAAQRRLLAQYETILKNMEDNEKDNPDAGLDAIIANKTGRARAINSVAISEKDIFIVSGDLKGFGYALWRMDHDFKNEKQVMTGLSGCCGQMDVQCCGEDVLVAQNTLHKFARFDRDGKAKGAWGKRAGGAEVECFGGCCNPMNLRSCKGDIYTAESEGIIKRFTDKGEFVCVVGFAPLTGGCKNVAVAVSPDGSKVYFADQPGSQIIVLTKKDRS